MRGHLRFEPAAPVLPELALLATRGWNLHKRQAQLERQLERLGAQRAELMSVAAEQQQETARQVPVMTMDRESS